MLENAVELQPNDTETKLLLANVCLHSGNPTETLEVLKGLPPGTGHPGEAMILTAEARALTGDFDLARTDLSLALEADPANPNYLLVSAWLDQMQAQFEPALATLEKARALEGDKPDLLYQMAVSYYFLGKFAQAAAACETVIHLAPQYDRAYLLDGLSKLELKEMGAARAAIERAVALSPQSALYHRELGVTLYRMGQLTSSEAELDRALTLDPHAVQAYYWRAQVLEQKGEPQRAIEDLETSIALEPKFLEAYSALAKLYSAQGQAQKAAAMLDTAKKLDQTERPSDRHRVVERTVRAASLTRPRWKFPVRVAFSLCFGWTLHCPIPDLQRESSMNISSRVRCGPFGHPFLSRVDLRQILVGVLPSCEKFFIGLGSFSGPSLQLVRARDAK